MLDKISRFDQRSQSPRARGVADYLFGSEQTIDITVIHPLRAVLHLIRSIARTQKHVANELTEEEIFFTFPSVRFACVRLTAIFNHLF